MHHRIALLALALAVALAGCSAADSQPAPTMAGPPPAHDDARVDQRFAPALQAAAAAYLTWGRVDARPNIAPGLCRAPMPQDYGSTGDVHLSSAAATSPHGKKLYYLYASQGDDYRTLGLQALAQRGPLPVGFTVVKQSFTPRAATKAEVDEVTAYPMGRLGPYKINYNSSDQAAPGLRMVAAGDGSFLVPDKQKDLFIMTKVATSEVDGTDGGWVYGTVAPDGTVTSAGRVGTCMGCHVKAARFERLFGMKTVEQ